MLRITADTNVLISAILNPHGIPAEILHCVRQREIRLVLSCDILDEVRRVLGYPKLQKLFKRKGMAEDALNAFMDHLEDLSEITAGNLSVNAVERDPSANMFLACAAEGRAAFIVSGDYHLTDLESFQGIPIVTPAGFLKHFSSISY